MNEIINKYLIKKTDNTLIQFSRYLFVGGIATIFDMGTLLFSTEILGIHYLLSAVLAFVVGLTTNYILSIFWIFESTKNFKKEFSLFAVIGIGGLLWTELILWIFVDRLSFSIMLSKVIAVILVLFWNFGMRKKIVFDKKLTS